jgi:hypothetical protein
MNKRRAAEVFYPITPDRQGQGRVGSGYLVTENPILTALHTIVPPGEPSPASRYCEVLILEDAINNREWRPATVVWPLEAEWMQCAGLDVALLRIDKPDEFTRHLAQKLEALDFRNAEGDRIECRAAGYPDSAVYGRNNREIRLMSGYTDSTSGSKQRVLFIGLAPDDALILHSVSGTPRTGQDSPARRCLVVRN